MRNDEREKVLEMLSQGQISSEEAARLLDCLSDGEEKQRKSESTQMHSDAQRMKGKKLRVDVNGFTEGDKKVNVNVSVPLVLARYADNIIANCMPESANKGLKEKGIDLRELNISKIIDTFEDLDEDIVNADIDQDDTKMKVRVYVD